MAKERDHTWFIDPLGDERTNELIGKELGQHVEESECRFQLCEDGQERQLWECPSYDFVARFERTAKRRQFPYDVYVREGKYGPIRLRPPFKKHTPKVHRVNGRLTITA